MKMVAIAAGLALSAAALPLQAQVKPEDQIKLRKSAYALMGNNFGSLAAMAQGKKPFDRDLAARNARLVATLADVPREHFGPGSDKGDTKAKPEIWSNRADFDAKMDKMIAETKRLPDAAADLATLKKAVGDVGGACKACHDDYRAK
jgi:cytochrome c556